MISRVFLMLIHRTFQFGSQIPVTIAPRHVTFEAATPENNIPRCDFLRLFPLTTNTVIRCTNKNIGRNCNLRKKKVFEMTSSATLLQLHLKRKKWYPGCTKYISFRYHRYRNWRICSQITVSGIVK